MQFRDVTTRLATKQLAKGLLVFAFTLVSVNACKTPGSNTGSGTKEAAVGANDPLSSFGVPMVNWKRYEANSGVAGAIPKAASLRTYPWTDTYWPAYRGYTANRWQSNTNSENHLDFIKKPGNEFPSPPKQLTADQIAVLSPAEKYDLLTNSR
jgi:hypothetical protein